MGLFSKLFNTGVKAEHSDEQQPANVVATGEFSMIVEDVFTIAGRGTVVTGKVESGVIHVGDEIKINHNINTRVIGIEAFRKQLDYASAGENVGLLLSDIDRDMVNRDDILTE